MVNDITIRPMEPGAYEALRECMNVAFHEELSRRGAELWSTLLPVERTAFAFDGDRLVGTSGAFPKELAVPGGDLPVAGVTIVTVQPTHRRRGILTQMMARLTEQAVDAGDVLAALWAAEGAIYGRFGYGAASHAVTFELPGGSGQLARRPQGAYTFTLHALEGAAPLLEPVWERARVHRTGITTRHRRWWENAVLVDLEEEREGARETRLVVAHDAAGAPAAYALYRARPTEPATTLEVLELVGATPDAEAAAWEYLRSVDLVGTITAERRPVDDPLPHRLADPREVQVQGRRDALWLRILDLPAAVSRRAWAAPLDLTLELADRCLPANAGRWRLEASTDGDARVTRSGGDPDLVLDTAALGAAYLGGTSPVTLADAGQIDERTPGAAERLAAALQTPRAPWSPDQF